MKLQRKQQKKATMQDTLQLDELDSDDEWIAELQFNDAELDAYQELDANVALEEDQTQLEDEIGAQGIKLRSRKSRQRHKKRKDDKGKVHNF